MDTTPPPPGADLPPTPAAGTRITPTEAIGNGPRTMRTLLERSGSQTRSVGGLQLRPLGIPGTLDAAMRLIRHCPGPTLGVAALGAAVAVLLPYVYDAFGALVIRSDAGIRDASTGGWQRFLAETLLVWIQLAAVTVICTPVTLAALQARALTTGQAYRELRGRRPALLAVAILCFLFWLAALGVPVMAIVAMYRALPLLLVISLALFCLTVWVPLVSLVWIRWVRLAIPIACTEPGGVRLVFGRSRQLSRGASWRLLAGASAAGLLSYLIAAMLTIPFALAAEFLGSATSGTARFWSTSTLQALGTLVSLTYSLAFLATVSALQYADRRVRAEAWGLTR